MANMLEANSLRALQRVRHAFFTRGGGVSDGVYASLNGGPGSEDAPAKVAENRARMAAVLGVVAAGACLAPALRAARVNPSVALRCE